VNRTLNTRQQSIIDEASAQLEEVLESAATPQEIADWLDGIMLLIQRVQHQLIEQLKQKGGK
jgi:hypothetical protein